MHELLERLVPSAYRPSGTAVLSVLSLLVVSVVSFNAESVDTFGRWWSDPTYSHGLLLAPLTLALILRALAPLAPTRQGGDWLALVALIGIALLMLLASLADIVAVYQLLLPALVLAGLLTVYGRRAFAELWLPVGFLYFSIPVWGALNPLLQSITTAAVERLIFLAGVPAFIDGNFVTVSAGIFEIAEGCSGLRFFVISTAISTLYSYLYLDGWRSKTGFIMLAVLLSIIGNWIRVFFVILMGIRLGIDHPFVTDHASVGWVIFAVTMIILFSVAGRFRHTERKTESDSNDTGKQAGLRLASIVPACVLALLFGAVSAAETIATRNSPRELGVLSWLQMGTDRPECRGWRTELQGADDERRGIVQMDGMRLCADITFFATQEQGRELINSGNRFFPTDRGWREQERKRNVGLTADTRLVRRPGAAPLLVAHQYRVAGVATVAPRRAKLLQLEGLLAGRADGLLIAYAMTCDDTCIEAFARGDLPPVMDVALRSIDEWDFVGE